MDKHIYPEARYEDIERRRIHDGWKRLNLDVMIRMAIKVNRTGVVDTSLSRKLQPHDSQVGSPCRQI